MGFAIHKFTIWSRMNADWSITIGGRFLGYFEERGEGGNLISFFILAMSIEKLQVRMHRRLPFEVVSPIEMKLGVN